MENNTDATNKKRMADTISVFENQTADKDRARLGIVQGVLEKERQIKQHGFAQSDIAGLLIEPSVLEPLMMARKNFKKLALNSISPDDKERIRGILNLFSQDLIGEVSLG